MTSTSYRSQLECLKAPVVQPFKVVCKSGGFFYTNIVDASVACHALSGKLYRVYRTPSLRYEETQIEPLPNDIARRLMRKTPKPHDIGLRCVPMWR